MYTPPDLVHFLLVLPYPSQIQVQEKNTQAVL